MNKQVYRGITFALTHCLYIVSVLSVVVFGVYYIFFLPDIKVLCIGISEAALIFIIGYVDKRRMRRVATLVEDGQVSELVVVKFWKNILNHIDLVGWTLTISEMGDVCWYKVERVEVDGQWVFLHFSQGIRSLDKGEFEIIVRPPSPYRINAGLILPECREDGTIWYTIPGKVGDYIALHPSKDHEDG